MIDSGAVMLVIYAFEELRIGAYDAGIAYEDLGKIVNNAAVLSNPWVKISLVQVILQICSEK